MNHGPACRLTLKTRIQSKPALSKEPISSNIGRTEGVERRDEEVVNGCREAIDIKQDRARFVPSLELTGVEVGLTQQGLSQNDMTKEAATSKMPDKLDSNPISQTIDYIVEEDEVEEDGQSPTTIDRQEVPIMRNNGVAGGTILLGQNSGYHPPKIPSAGHLTSRAKDRETTNLPQRRDERSFYPSNTI